ncbi:UNVERIFIED_CONTAM: hypothetical protein Sradi_3300200, partial [Sesamum radiatum]
PINELLLFFHVFVPRQVDSLMPPPDVRCCMPKLPPFLVWPPLSFSISPSPSTCSPTSRLSAHPTGLCPPVFSLEQICRIPSARVLPLLLPSPRLALRNNLVLLLNSLRSSCLGQLL